MSFREIVSNGKNRNVLSTNITIRFHLPFSVIATIQFEKKKKYQQNTQTNESIRSVAL